MLWHFPSVLMLPKPRAQQLPIIFPGETNGIESVHVRITSVRSGQVVILWLLPTTRAQCYYCINLLSANLLPF